MTLASIFIDVVGNKYILTGSLNNKDLNRGPYSSYSEALRALSKYLEREAIEDETSSSRGFSGSF